jgi:tetratricopeptide (TPR) repeat protein
MTSLKTQAIQTALTGNWKNAISLNKKLLDENPLDIDTLNRLALAYAISGKVKDAKNTYQKVLDIDPLNPIALKNAKRLKEKTLSANKNTGSVLQISNNFLEETGKTKVIELVNLAQPKLIQTLRTGQFVSLSIKRSKIFVLVEEKEYIGVLPDDIGRKLIKFLKSGNKYDAYIKSANPHHVVIFIKETKRSSRYKDHPSFLNVGDANLAFDRNGRIKNSLRKRVEAEKEDEDAEDYTPEEESE